MNQKTNDAAAASPTVSDWVRKVEGVLTEADSNLTNEEVGELYIRIQQAIDARARARISSPDEQLDMFELLGI
jgi:hypothetical protein